MCEISLKTVLMFPEIFPDVLLVGTDHAAKNFRLPGYDPGKKTKEHHVEFH